jgi:hypothetical protein
MLVDRSFAGTLDPGRSPTINSLWQVSWLSTFVLADYSCPSARDFHTIPLLSTQPWLPAPVELLARTKTNVAVK